MADKPGETDTKPDDTLKSAEELAKEVQTELPQKTEEVEDVIDSGNPDEIAEAVKEHEEWIMEKLSELMKANSSAPEIKEAISQLRNEMSEVREILKTILDQTKRKAPLQESTEAAKSRVEGASQEVDQSGTQSPPKSPVNWI